MEDPCNCICVCDAFRCRNQQCRQTIFAKRLSALAAPRARETARFREVAGEAGYALGGLPAQRLLRRLGIRIGRDTILRRVRHPRRAGGLMIWAASKAVGPWV
jgi:hypothetical protein